MKQITQSQRPIGKNSNYICFYSEDVIQETEKAFLVSLYFERIGEKANRWLPKSKMLAFEHIDNRDLVDNGKDFVKNTNYGKARVQYFISSFFAKDKGAEKPTLVSIVERNEAKYGDGVNLEWFK